MAKIVTVHSFRGGTGKSNLSANLTTALALQGLRVAVFDTDLASPGIHVLFGFSPGADELMLNDYLQAGAQIRHCAHEVTPPAVKAASGRIWLVPAAMSGDRIAKLLREGYMHSLERIAPGSAGKQMALILLCIHWQYSAYPADGEAAGCFCFVDK